MLKVEKVWESGLIPEKVCYKLKNCGKVAKCWESVLKAETVREGVLAIERLWEKVLSIEKVWESALNV